MLNNTVINDDTDIFIQHNNVVQTSVCEQWLWMFGTPRTWASSSYGITILLLRFLVTSTQLLGYRILLSLCIIIVFRETTEVCDNTLFSSRKLHANCNSNFVYSKNYMQFTFELTKYMTVLASLTLAGYWRKLGEGGGM